MSNRTQEIRIEIEALLDKTIQLNVFSVDKRQVILDYVLRNTSSLPPDVKLSGIQMEYLEIFVSKYRKLEIKNNLIPITAEPKFVSNYNHYVLSKSDQVPVGMFDFSRVEQY